MSQLLQFLHFPSLINLNKFFNKYFNKFFFLVNHAPGLWDIPNQCQPNQCTNMMGHPVLYRELTITGTYNCGVLFCLLILACARAGAFFGNLDLLRGVALGAGGGAEGAAAPVEVGSFKERHGIIFALNPRSDIRRKLSYLAKIEEIYRLHELAPTTS